jgi:hypothetical protein
MPLYRYILVSSIDQDLESLHAALKVAGSDIIRAQKTYFHSPPAAV